MKRTWTIIGVADVPQSFKWYQSLLGLPETAPAHDYFGQIVDSDGTVLLCLHEWGAHEHPSFRSRFSPSLICFVPSNRRRPAGTSRIAVLCVNVLLQRSSL
jgi:catechol 2,3-dioxygenase-like lactoylglutathione lyase family enzyme